MKNEIKDILGILSGDISMSALARHIGMHRAAFQFKLNESIVNGTKYCFSDEEIELLSRALTDIGQRIKTAADKLTDLARKNEREKGRYYTEHNPFDNVLFRQWLELLPQGIKVLEPFCGNCKIPMLLSEIGYNADWFCLDIEPPKQTPLKVVKHDTIKKFPKGYKVAMTNPPYLGKNSAVVRHLDFPQTKYNDLYLLCLDLMLANCQYVAAIIPESFITQNLFHSRLYGVVSINFRLFSDTECPVCLALFIPDGGNDFIIYRGNEKIGTYSELKQFDLSEYQNGYNWTFNDPGGQIGTVCIDDHNQNGIKFVRGNEIAGHIKHSSRSYTRISGIPNGIDLDTFIGQCNEVLQDYRDKTNDIFLTSYKGLRKDGRYRRRIDFKTIRCIMNKVAFRYEVNKQHKVVIFDFDGTLLDTRPLLQYEFLFKKPQRGTDEWKRGRKEYLSHIKDCKKWEGIDAVIDYIRQHHIKTCIVTANTKDRVIEAIKVFGWQDVFDKSNIIGCYALGMKRASKDNGDTSLFRKALEVLNVEASECIAFGNEVSDAKAAQNVGIMAYNCLWGATDDERKIMRHSMANMSIDSPLQIVEKIKTTHKYVNRKVN